MDATLDAGLNRYLDLLLEANATMNLTALRERDAAWRHLVLESLDLLPLLEPLAAGARVVDVGSGGGSPAIPLALARRDLDWTLIEATGKKARFLEDTAAALGLGNVRVIADRAETRGRDPALRGRFAAATCRAVGPLRELLEYTLPFLKVGGVLLAAKGPRAADELRDARRALERLGGGGAEILAVGDGTRSLVVVRVIQQTPSPKAYPRPPGMPHAQPL